MISGRSDQPTPGTPVRLDLSAITEALASIEKDVCEDPTRVALLSDLETLVCAATGAQAALAVDLERSQLAAREAAGVRASERGRGIAAHVGLARRESGHRGTVLLGLARTVMGDLPHLAGAWRAGRISERRVQLIVTQASCLESPERKLLDTRMAGTPARVEELARMGNKQIENDAAQIAYDLDKKAVFARRQKAEGDRHTRLRRAPDGMAWFSALVPLKEGSRSSSLCPPRRPRSAIRAATIGLPGRSWPTPSSTASPAALMRPRSPCTWRSSCPSTSPPARDST